MPVERTFDAMGTWCHAVLRGVDSSMLDDVESDVAELQELWSRFEEDSELSRLNARPGVPRRVSAATRQLAQRALIGWRLSGGLFDPFQADRMAAVGYGRDFDELEPVRRPVAAPRRSLSARPVVIDRKHNTLTVASGAGLDSGGIGKGFAADLVAVRALARGATGALVNLGGDLRCVGLAPEGGWRISLDDAWRPGEPSDVTIKLQEGSICTSSPLRRSWSYSDGSRGNHLLDPRTGLSVGDRIAAVSVIAPQGWLAEVLTKTLLLAPRRRAAALLRRHQAGAVITYRDGARVQLP